MKLEHCWVMTQTVWIYTRLMSEIIPKESNQGRSEIENFKWQIVLDAAASQKAGGKLFGTEIRNDDGTGAGYVTGFTRQEFGLRVLFQVGVPRKYELKIRYRSNSDRNGRVLAGNHLFFDGVQNLSYEQYINRGTKFPKIGRAHV